MKIHTENISGNLHQAATEINKRGWAEYVVTMSYTSGNYTVAVFSMPNEMVVKIREESPSYASDPYHDDSEQEKDQRREDKTMLQQMCTDIANFKPVPRPWMGDDAKPKPWGCIRNEVNNPRYCDDCPVSEYCPHEGKRWSK